MEKKKTMICPQCGSEVPIGFKRYAKRKDGVVIRPSKGKRCLTIPMCACWMS